ncbi:MAG: helix-turn-helix domain-containing protein [Oscillospiraceae bacterium]|nr:helix-turn-helix domain-containing protein [Oscillospiraceae bacterium]
MKTGDAGAYAGLSDRESEELKRIKEIFTEYLLKKRRPEELIHQAGELMQCPVMLTTNAYRVLVMDDMGFEVDDPIWQAAKKKGYCDADSVARFETEGVTRKVLEQDRAFVLDSGLAESIPRILRKIDVFGKTGAYIGLFQMGRAFTAADLTTADLLCQVLSVMLEREPKTIDSREEIRQGILYDLIEGRVTDTSVLSDRIRWASWELKPLLRCVLIISADRNSDIDNKEYISYLMTSRISGSKVLSVPEGLLMVINYGKAGLFSALGGFLRETAEKYGLLMYASGEFSELSLVREHYDICQLMGKMVSAGGPADRLCCFDGMALEVLAQSLDARRRRIFAQPMYLSLSQYDKRHSTEYCRTVCAFIESGCSVTAAAAKLYIHRNTMNKRLNRISEICGLDLSNGKELIHFYLTDKLTGGRGG